MARFLNVLANRKSRKLSYSINSDIEGASGYRRTSARGSVTGMISKPDLNNSFTDEQHSSTALVCNPLAVLYVQDAFQHGID